jgi:RimJ/RimL family protein N-acetyltransferase
VGEWNGVEIDGLVLTSDRLTLRPWRAGDAADVEAIMTEPAMHDFLPLPDPYTSADAEQFVTDIAVGGRRDGSGLSCALAETGTGRLVGAAELRLPGPRDGAGEIGYWVAVPARGAGYSTEAARSLADWAFAHGLHRVEIRCAVANIASAKAALRAGFRFESVLRGREKTPRGPEDGAIFARLAGDDGQPVAPAFPPLPSGQLSDGTLALRALCAADADAVYEEAANDEARQWAFSASEPDRRACAAKAAQAPLHWLVGSVAELAMVDATSGAVAGTMQVRRAGPPGVAGVGYGVLPGFRGRGYTARGLRLLAPWAFEAAGLARLELGAKAANVASQKAATAGGFAPEGVRDARLPNPDGSYSDEVRFALVNPRVIRR